MNHTYPIYIICTVLISGKMFCYFFITSLLFQLYLLFTAWTLKFVHIRFDSVNPFFIIIFLSKKWWTISNFKFVIDLMLSNILQAKIGSKTPNLISTYFNVQAVLRYILGFSKNDFNPLYYDCDQNGSAEKLRVCIHLC